MRRALWVNLAAVNLVLVLLSRLFYLPPLYGYDTRLQIRILVALFPLAMAISIWQLVGLWRAAGKDRQAGRFRVAVRALVALAGGGLVSLGFVTGSAALDVARSAVGYDGMAAYRLQVLKGGILSVEGDIGFGLAHDVRQAIAEHPQLTRVRLNSMGGRGSEGVLLARVIEEAGLDTEVTRGCFSACSFAFLGGRQRTLIPPALLGFHWKRPGSAITDLELALQLHRLFARAGVDPAFAAQTFRVPIDDLWIPTPVELRAANVTTAGASMDAAKLMRGYGPDPHPRTPRLSLS